MGIYLNTASTTEVDEQVLDDFVYCCKNCWWNASDVNNYSLLMKEIIEQSQQKIATTINAKQEEIIFTSGGSESNNWAIKGYTDCNHVDVIITTKIEHPSVYNTCRFLEEHGYKVEYCDVNGSGVVSLKSLIHILEKYENKKILVSIMLTNNEIGTIQPIREIAGLVHEYGGVLHTDAVQTYMHHKIDVAAMGIDLMSTSFHKIGGFKGLGFLYVKNGTSLTPLIHGGKQFDYKRSGTENVAMISACSDLAVRLNNTLNKDIEYCKDINKYMLKKIFDSCYGLCKVTLNGGTVLDTNRSCNILNLTFRGIDADHLIMLLELKCVYVSAGSACCAGEKTPSRVLKEIGLTNEDAFDSIRISFDKTITKDIVNQFVSRLTSCIKSMKTFENTESKDGKILEECQNLV